MGKSTVWWGFPIRLRVSLLSFLSYSLSSSLLGFNLSSPPPLLWLSCFSVLAASVSWRVDGKTGFLSCVTHLFPWVSSVFLFHSHCFFLLRLKYTLDWTAKQKGDENFVWLDGKSAWEVLIMCISDGVVFSCLVGMGRTFLRGLCYLGRLTFPTCSFFSFFFVPRTNKRFGWNGLDWKGVHS